MIYMKKAAVYTRTGDKGTTGLYTGERVPKQSLRVEAYGTVDEITSALGLARAQATREDVKETILNVQKLLMSAAFNDIALIHDKYKVGVTNGGQSVRYDKRGSALGELIHRLLNECLGACINRACRLI